MVTDVDDTRFSSSRIWNTLPVSHFKGAPFRLGEYMDRNRFEEILKAIRYTNMTTNRPDKFFEVRQLQDEWNKNMTKNFIPSWVSCLDESMSMWTNPFSCPGFMYVPRKPHPFGNEYHSVCCGETQVMWQVELVEGKDSPPHMTSEFGDKGKTVGLLLRMTRPIWYKGFVVVLDSGFCVLKGIVELAKKGVYGAALIKKRRYWPKYIKGDAIIDHFRTKEVGTADAWPGTLDNTPFHIFCMKEPDYVMSLMSSYGTCEEIADGATQRDFQVNGILLSGDNIQPFPLSTRGRRSQQQTPSANKH